MKDCKKRGRRRKRCTGRGVQCGGLSLDAGPTGNASDKNSADYAKEQTLAEIAVVMRKETAGNARPANERRKIVVGCSPDTDRHAHPPSLATRRRGDWGREDRRRRTTDDRGRTAEDGLDEEETLVAGGTQRIRTAVRTETGGDSDRQRKDRAQQNGRQG